MARVEIPVTVLTTAGDAIVGASVTVRKRSDNSLATLYQAETGGTTVSNPVVTDAYGRVSGWVDRGAYICNISGGTPAVVAYNEYFDATPGGDGTIDAGWIGDAMLPIASMMPYAAPGDPSGGSWVIANGRAISRTTYAALFAKIGTTYGAGDGSTTFNLPDMQGRVPVGLGTHAEVNSLATNEGASVGSRKIKHKHGKGTLSGTAADHTHLLPDMSGGAGGNTGGIDLTVAKQFKGYSVPSQPSGALGLSLSGEIGDTSGPLDAPAFQVTNFIIRVL